MSSLVISFQYVNTIAFAQTNANLSKTSTSTRTIPKGGVQLLLYIKKGGLTGEHMLFSYNIVSKQLTAVDLNNNTAKSKSLSNSEIQNLTNVFYSSDVTRENVYDTNLCPDCTQYGLSYSFIDLEKLVPFHGMGFWTDRTPDASGLKMLANVIEELSPK